jgi:hypothetical protein
MMDDHPMIPMKMLPALAERFSMQVAFDLA